MIKVQNQNFPNPTRGNTLIGFEIPVGGKLNFVLSNILGQNLIIHYYDLASGKHSLELNTFDLKAGIYYYSIELNGHRLTRKMIIH